MRISLAVVLGAVALCAAVAAAEDCPVQTGFINKTTVIDGVARKHVVYVPADYAADKFWPMIIFFHGSGERGDDGLLQTEVGLAPAVRRNPERFPAIILFPQCPKDKFWDSILPELDAMLADAEGTYNIDRKREYITGLSMGGYACWTWGAAQVDRFAAMLPICGGGIPNDMNRITAEPIDTSKFLPLKERVELLATIPIRAFHGAKDVTVPPFRSKQMVRMVDRQGGNVQYTEVPDVGHDVWNVVYQDAAVIKWLFEQKKP